MSCHCCLKKNKNYCISKRNYDEDYSNKSIKKYDFTLSGKYLLDNNSNLICDINFDEYPSSDTADELIRLIKEKNNINDLCVILGCGANGILQNLVKIFCYKGGNIVTSYFSFDQVEYANSSYDGYTKRVYQLESGKYDYKRMLDSIDNDTNFVYITNPNNITGICEDNDDIISFSKKINIPLIVDESAIEFTTNKSLAEEQLPSNMIVVRSFSKAYGLSNLRIGYVVMNEKNAIIYKSKTTKHEISDLVIKYAINSIKNNNYVENVKIIKAEKNRLISALLDNGIKCYNSSSNVICTYSKLSNEFFEKLDCSGISYVLIKDQIGLSHIRFAIQKVMINNKLIEIIKQN